jgi:hypothetical protein
VDVQNLDPEEILDEEVEVEEETGMAAVVVAVEVEVVVGTRILGPTDMITTCPKKPVPVFRSFLNLKFIA